MNFDYLQAHGDLKVLYKHCHEAEALATLFPTSSAISSRKAMEFIVKLIYSSRIGTPAYSMTIFEMVTEQAFVDYIQDETILNTIHIIRKMGNVAAHDGTLTVEEAVNVLEQLHFLVGETCILLGLETDYPEFVKPGTQPAAPAAATAPKAVPASPTVAPTKPAEAVKEKVVVAPEIVAKYGPRIAHYGTACQICGFDFGKTYGPAFAGRIEVHHIVPLSEIREDYVVDPIHDLIPVCSNCHTALHCKKDGVYTPEELKTLLTSSSDKKFD